MAPGAVEFVVVVRMGVGVGPGEEAVEETVPGAVWVGRSVDERPVARRRSGRGCGKKRPRASTTLSVFAFSAAFVFSTSWLKMAIISAVASPSRASSSFTSASAPSVFYVKWVCKNESVCVRACACACVCVCVCDGVHVHVHVFVCVWRSVSVCVNMLPQKKRKKKKKERKKEKKKIFKTISGLFLLSFTYVC